MRRTSSRVDGAFGGDSLRIRRAERRLDGNIVIYPRDKDEKPETILADLADLLQYVREPGAGA